MVRDIRSFGFALPLAVFARDSGELIFNSTDENGKSSWLIKTADRESPIHDFEYM